MTPSNHLRHVGRDLHILIVTLPFYTRSLRSTQHPEKFLVDKYVLNIMLKITIQFLDKNLEKALHFQPGKKSNMIIFSTVWQFVEARNASVKWVPMTNQSFRSQFFKLVKCMYLSESHLALDLVYAENEWKPPCCWLMWKIICTSC